MDVQKARAVLQLAKAIEQLIAGQAQLTTYEVAAAIGEAVSDLDRTLAPGLRHLILYSMITQQLQEQPPRDRRLEGAVAGTA